MVSTLSEDQVDAALRALADPERRRIIRHLAQAPATMTDLVKLESMTPLTTTYQIRVLKNAGIVTANRFRKNQVIYQLNDETIFLIKRSVFSDSPD